MNAIATHTDQVPERGAPHPGDFARQLSDIAMKSLDDDKAEDVVVIDLAGKTAIADTMIIASGRSTRHVGAMADHLNRKFREAGVNAVEVEGLPQADWVLIDAGDVIVHLFRPEVRSFYQLEKMWGVEPPASAGQAVYRFA